MSQKQDNPICHFESIDIRHDSCIGFHMPLFQIRSTIVEDLTFRLEINPKLEDWICKLGVFSLSEDPENLARKRCHINLCHFFIFYFSVPQTRTIVTLWVLFPEICSRSIGLIESYNVCGLGP